MKTVPMSPDYVAPGAPKPETSPSDPLGTGRSVADYKSMGLRLPTPPQKRRTPSHPSTTSASRPMVQRGSGDGRIYAIFGCKGGAGATTLAVNLATSLAQSTPRGTVIVDLDLQLGDVLCALNLMHVHNRATVTDLLQEIDDLQGSALRRRLAQHNGTYVLSQGGALDQLSRIQPERISALLDGLARHFDAVVIDGLRDFSDISLAALDCSDQILLVLTQEVPAVRSAARAVDVFRQLDYPESRMALVMNRCRWRAPLRVGAISETLQLPVAAVLPNDGAAVERAMTHGLPLRECATRARITRHIERLAGRIFSGRVLARRGFKLSDSGIWKQLRRKWRRAFRTAMPPREVRP